jgi:GNAT superfamily N-acetyltransferase
MKVRIRDADALRALDPFDITAYLRAKGWRQTADISGKASLWFLTTPEDEFGVTVPQRSDFRDYVLASGCGWVSEDEQTRRAHEETGANDRRRHSIRCCGTIHDQHWLMRHWMLRQLELEDMDRAAAVHRVSFDHMLPTLAGLHTPEEDRWFFRERMFTTCELWGYFDNQELVGIIAFREGWIDQLYVLPSSQGRGVGTALLQIAKSRSLGLSLWTFQCNRNARRFYDRQGFTLIKETDGSANEEKEPDALYFWPSGR